LALVLALGFFFRLWKLGTIPAGVWFDEASFGNAALDKVVQTGEAPLFFGTPHNNPGLYFWVLAAFFRFFGPHLLVLRSLSAFFGCLALIPFWVLAREWFGPRLALVATLVYGSMRWVFIFERAAFMLPLAEFWMLCTVACVVKGMRAEKEKEEGGGRRGPGSMIWWGLAGLALGISLYCYLPIRLFVPILAAWFLAGWLLKRPVAVWRPILFMAGTAFVVVLPLAWFALQHWPEFTAYSGRVSVFRDVQARGWGELGRNLGKHLSMFQFHGDDNGRHNLSGRPQLDPVTAVLFLPALVLCHLLFAKDGRARLLVIWFWGMLSAGFLSMATEAPQAHRSGLLAPLVPLALGLMLEHGQGLAFKTFDRVPRSLVLSAWMLIALVPVLDAREYFGLWAGDQATWRSYSPDASAAAERLASQGPGWALRVSPLSKLYAFNGYELREVVRFRLREEGLSFATLQAHNRMAPQEADQGVLCLWDQSDGEMTEAAKAEFPDLVPESPASQGNAFKPLYLALAIPKGRIPFADDKEAAERKFFVYFVKQQDK
jgi:4-amino-4-deoxy-L-arabinose transferase-like glycosyltransferase